MSEINSKKLIAAKISTQKLDDESGNHALITIAPLEKGYGNTLGNALRRILLSSIPGVAVTSIKIDSVLHEFSTIPNVVEDVIEIVLNVKGIVAKLHNGDEDDIDSFEARSATIDVVGPQEVTAADIKCDSELEILNPEHHIATVGEGGRFYMELCFEKGRGYVSNEKNKMRDTMEKANNANGGKPVGTIFVDSIYTPVYKVNYNVEDYRIGANSDYDKLTLDVTTNGVVTAAEAVAYAARTFQDYLNLIADELNGGKPENGTIIKKEENNGKALDAPKLTIEELELSVRSYNCLKRAGIETVAEIISKSEGEMMKIRNLGRKSLEEIINKVHDLGQSLRAEEE